MTGKPLDQLIELTDPEGCHVINLPSRIWVLGGTFESDGPNLSFRDAFWRRTLTAAVPRWLVALLRPEDLEGWLEHSGYADLTEFERDACYLSRAIIVFAESPGSYAELGSIVIDQSLAQRLAVVVQQKYRADNARGSFLNLGPLRRTEEAGGLICIIDPDRDFELRDADYDAIISSVQAWLPEQHKREKFRPTDRAHAFLIVADLVDALLIATETDLLDALRHFSVAFRQEDLRQCLGMLKFLRLVRLYEFGTVKYYLRESADEGPWIDYTSKYGVFDRARFKIKAQEGLNRNLLSIYERARR